MSKLCSGRDIVKGQHWNEMPHYPRSVKFRFNAIFYEKCGMLEVQVALAESRSEILQHRFECYEPKCSYQSLMVRPPPALLSYNDMGCWTRTRSSVALSRSLFLLLNCQAS
jgi:hypothetical protein